MSLPLYQVTDNDLELIQEENHDQHFSGIYESQHVKDEDFFGGYGNGRGRYGGSNRNRNSQGPKLALLLLVMST